MLDSVAVGVIVGGAALWLVVRLVRRLRGKGGGGCAGCCGEGECPAAQMVKDIERREARRE